MVLIITLYHTIHEMGRFFMVQKKESFFLSSDGKTRIHTVTWQKDEAPRAVLQLAHGICEYVWRYDAFASFLAERGFLVVGNDHLGHGKSWQQPEREGLFAEKDGWSRVVDDVETLRRNTAASYPGVPYFMLGHSMGSFVLRTWLVRHPGKIDGAIICGTGQQSASVVNMGLAVTGLLCKLRGALHRSEFVKKLAFGAYNNRISPRRTENDWICSDNAVVDAYCADRGCQFLPTVSLYRDMMGGIRLISDPEKQKQMDPETPILFIAGQQDPVGDYGKGVERAYQGFLQAGCRHVQKIFYPDGRHEILNETFRAQVWNDVLNWLTALLPQA